MGALIKDLVTCRQILKNIRFIWTNFLKMKILLSCAIMLSMLFLAYCEENDCALLDICYNDGDIQRIHHVGWWEVCGYFCYLTDGCEYWTFHDDGYCSLKTGNEYVQSSWNCISGDKNCH